MDKFWPSIMKNYSQICFNRQKKKNNNDYDNKGLFTSHLRSGYLYANGFLLKLGGGGGRTSANFIFWSVQKT